MIREKSSGAVVFRQAGKKIKYLLLHYESGHWDFPRGHIERGETEQITAAREIKEETGLDSGVGEHICTFDQIKNSGYYLAGTQHIFVDKVARVQSKKVSLNYEAQEYIWIPPKIALRDLPIEPNARHTLELYSKIFAAA